MHTWALIAILSSTLLSIPSWSLPVAVDQDLSQRQADFAAWMSSTGLSRDFEIVRIGDGPYPDPELADAPFIQHLELRFLTRKSIEADETARFQQLLDKYQAGHPTTLPEKIFYEFTHTFALQRREACVDLHVMEAVYSVYLPRGRSELVVLAGGNRSPRLFSVTIPAIAPQEQFRIRGGKQSAENPKDMTDAVEKILTTYLVDANKAKGAATPDITPERDYAYGYLGLTVQGVKGLVTDHYWEWLSIEVQYHNEPTDPPAKQTLWKFSCSVHVRYASGPHEKSPSDADSDYPQQVVNFRNKLVDQLQKTLERGSHD